jgi:ribosomal protein S9
MKMNGNDARTKEREMLANANANTKSKRKPAVERVLAKHGLKGTLSVSGKCALVLKLRSGTIDFANSVSFHDGHYLSVAATNAISKNIRTGGHVLVNGYHIDRCWKSPAREVLRELYEAMGPERGEDYFVEVLIGGCNGKPYKLQTT